MAVIGEASALTGNHGDWLITGILGNFGYVSEMDRYHVSLYHVVDVAMYPLDHMDKEILHIGE